MSSPGRTRNDRLALTAAALVTLGAAIPLVMMVNGAARLDIDYFWWTWPAIPAIWLPALLGARLSTRRPALGALLVGLAAAAGLTVFRKELALITFGPAWLIALYLYLDAGPGLTLLRRRTEPSPDR